MAGYCSIGQSSQRAVVLREEEEEEEEILSQYLKFLAPQTSSALHVATQFRVTHSNNRYEATYVV
jgi:hypothetical protein